MPPPRTAAATGLRTWLLGSDPVRRALYIGGAVPGLWAFYLGVMNQLGADPMATLERLLGLWTLRFLILTLAVTPLRRLGGPNLIRYRRTLGLLAFYYALAHLTVYVVLDQGLDFGVVWSDIVKRPFITVGMAAFAILVPLAVTSNNPMIRRLGGAAWGKLHRWVYLAAALAALHFVMVVKAWPPEPLIYAAIVAVLLLFRLGSAVRKRLQPRPAAGPRPARATARSATR